MLLAFTGPAGSGKDTCGAYFIEKHAFEKLSFAAPLYDGLEAMGFGRPKTQDEKEAIIPWLGKSWRHLAQTLGTEWGRQLIDPNLWAKIVMAKVAANPGKSYVITDARFENEATAIRGAGGWIVHLEGRKAPMTEGTQGHASEKGLFKEAADYRLDNSLPLESLHTALRGLHGFLVNYA